ncbi:MAG: N-acetyl-gamma-glutamyl-phosphate reductase [Parasporobacterium sp.]|nr:N-acetyl-gamma-glutamyl-phosphate reductase [Parasporobacterium sp.]MBR3644733.1 N-acetyl-gamma-glutamyl-phosphate reductase [Parasporobacterium sp.]
MKRIFIDGSAGTTGLRIFERLSSREDISLIQLSEENRKDPQARKDAIFEADIAFLCLPDDAAIEAVSLAEGADTCIIDTSTAHRTAEGWTYGFPEIGRLREKIKTSKRIANPGCHASGFISLVAPLVENGVIPKNAQLSCFSLTGYTGGGKKMISEYETGKTKALEAPRMYGLSQNHKHLPEMSAVTGLTKTPVFCPVVADFPCGMEVVVPVTQDLATGTLKDICDIYQSYYKTGLVHFKDAADENGFLTANAFSGRDDMQISVFGNEERILLVSRFDNLGKGASGAALQNMNLVLGLDEETGLVV